MIYFLIGMMGSGKTSIGSKLAKALNYTFLDTDQLIQIYTNRSIKDMIEIDGIERFREIEKEVFSALNLKDQTIVSCGGGLILDEANITIMKKAGKVIYLEVSVLELLRRLNKVQLIERPLLYGDLETKLQMIYDERKERYEQTSDITVDCNGRTIEELLQQLVEIIVNDLKQSKIS